MLAIHALRRLAYSTSAISRLLDVIAFVVTASFLQMVQEWLIDKLCSITRAVVWPGDSPLAPDYHTIRDVHGRPRACKHVVRHRRRHSNRRRPSDDRAARPVPHGPRNLHYAAAYAGCLSRSYARCPCQKLSMVCRRHHTRSIRTVSDENWLAFTIPAVDSLFWRNPEPFDVIRAKKAQRRPGGATGKGAAEPRADDDRERARLLTTSHAAATGHKR